MAIKSIDKAAIDGVASRPARDVARPANADQHKERPEATRSPPHRPPNFVRTVARSLEQAGIATAPTKPTLETQQATSAENASPPDSRQDEKRAEGLQAFVHSLVQAVNTEKVPTGPTPSNPDSVTRPVAQGEAASTTESAANAYGGMVSRLEDLIRAIDGNAAGSGASKELAKLDAAFRNLVGSQSPRDSSGGGESGPDLQTVLKNVIRNLQSTGDPTLASTGNVINTAA